MLQVRKWTEFLRNFLHKGWKSTEHFLEKEDLLDSKWGHRVMDQIFREGRFSEKAESDSLPSERSES